MSNVSSDLIWAVTRSQNAFLVKRRSGGGVQFSSDPLNLTNKHSKTNAGYANDKAVGINADSEGKIVLTTKKSKGVNTPAKSTNVVAFGKSKPTRKMYKAVADYTGKNGYRSDLLPAAIQRTSALRFSQRVKKDTPASKPRGAKAKITA